MPLFTPTRSAQRYLGDSKTKVVHDLLNEQPECEALKVIADRRGERFVPDKLEFALSIGYKACPHCLPDYVVEEPPAEAPPETPPVADKAKGTGDIKAVDTEGIAAPKEADESREAEAGKEKATKGP